MRGPSAGNGSTGDLIDFLHARLSDDERVAPLAAEVMALRASTAGFGARLLREVQAKRRILDLHQPTTMTAGYGCMYCGERGACTTVRLLALPHADHPDYRPEWRP